MKSYRIVFAVLVVCLSVFASAASKNEPKPTQSSNASAEFDKLKELSGEWISRSASDPMSVTRHTYRVVSNGSVVMLTTDVPSEGPMITMFYLDGNRLLLTHYCDAGNRPRMAARTSPDGKTVEFDFLDVSGSTSYGHMQHAVFTMVDENHHLEDWTFLMPGDKPVHARMELRRAQ